MSAYRFCRTDDIALLVEALNLEVSAAEIDPGAPRWVRGDANRLRQIVQNLVALFVESDIGAKQRDTEARAATMQ